MPEHAVRQRRVEEAHERMRRRLVPERSAPGPAAREERAKTQEALVGGPYVALPRARGPDGGDETSVPLKFQLADRGKRLNSTRLPRPKCEGLKSKNLCPTRRARANNWICLRC